ncbi:peptide/nickel transport system ATP-binding protein [Dietzia kunjamensis]|uniref:ATP-binding cassette domain-containing protein n=1 Tax=Dietzia kunjamensis TaxID=322509 RepID=UPI000E715333|nr:ATP-binding cassette domain-containing protein [Dietzia kunjamensis]RKE59552.1 peptide/nickel transport system ATP-binding protein [Dietzia kunjamensis]
MTLSARGVAFRHAGPDGFALPPTDLTVCGGRITALVGPSGSGKTTLAHLLAGLLAPTAGTVTVTDEPGTPTDGPGVREVRRRRGRLPGHTALLNQDPMASADPRMTLRRMIALPGRLRGSPVDVDALAREVGLDPGLLDRRPEQVSGGQLHRACLARALAQRPRYLIADEATAHLDPESTNAIAGVLRARADGGLGVLAITHDQRLAADWADVVHTMGDAAGS